MAHRPNRPARPCHVVITGASSGLGAALARTYARDGVRLTLLGRDAGRLDGIAADCRRSGAPAIATVVGDVRDAEAMAAALLDADAESAVDLVIASAGMGGADVMAGRNGESGVLARAVIETNVVGVVNVVTPLLPVFVARGCGHLALVSSIAGLHGLAESPVYSASKAAVRVYGHGLRRLLSGSGVGVTVITAGFVDTPMSQSLPFRPPFVVAADAAANRVQRCIAAGVAEYVFPWPLRLAATACTMLPTSVVDGLLRGCTRRFCRP